MTRFSLGSIDGTSYEVARDGAPVGQPAELEVAIGQLDSRLRMEIAQPASRWAFIHAGTVAVGERALVLPCLSFSGKTTMSADALLADGRLPPEFAAACVRTAPPVWST